MEPKTYVVWERKGSLHFIRLREVEVKKPEELVILKNRYPEDSYVLAPVGEMPK